jgi:hypothetical protein
MDVVGNGKSDSGEVGDTSISRNISLISGKESDGKVRMTARSEAGGAMQGHDNGPVQNEASASGASHNPQGGLVPEAPPPAYSVS